MFADLFSCFPVPLTLCDPGSSGYKKQGKRGGNQVNVNKLWWRDSGFRHYAVAVDKVHLYFCFVPSNKFVAESNAWRQGSTPGDALCATDSFNLIGRIYEKQANYSKALDVFALKCSVEQPAVARERQPIEPLSAMFLTTLKTAAEASERFLRPSARC